MNTSKGVNGKKIKPAVVDCLYRKHHFLYCFKW